MSSLIARDAIRARLEAQLPFLPIVDMRAVRVNTESLGEQWLAIEYFGLDDKPISIGEPALWRETGTARVVVGFRAGTGDRDALVQAIAVGDAFRGWDDAAAGLTVDAVLPPREPEESLGAWYQVATDVSFHRDYTA